MRCSRLHFVDLGSRCILRQLQLEEALLRNDNRSFVLLNRALPRERSVVLGTSGKAHEHVHVENARADGVRLIRRYTGGGTVYIDNGTFFVSFIMNGNSVPQVESFPRPIMHWSSKLYKEVATFRVLVLILTKLCKMFDKCSSAQQFRMQENDYCFGERKFGGNAQSIAGKRWVHHTSFLWNCDLVSMQRYLQMPAKVGLPWVVGSCH